VSGMAHLAHAEALFAAAGLLYMCCREQRFWRLTPVTSVEPDFHRSTPAGGTPEYNRIEQGVPAAWNQHPPQEYERQVQAPMATGHQV
jgi:hypothetical protein